MSILQKVPKPLKLALKAKVLEARRAWVRAFRSYGDAELLATLRALGIREGDSLMLHSAFAAHHGYRGTVEDLTNVLLRAVGPAGHLAMVSMPYRTSSQQYLEKIKEFDVRRAPSMMGMVSEMFRRRDGVRRSAHPTHPILVYGPRADWIVEGHAACVYPCGPGTPFEKLLSLDTKAVFFNVGFEVFTFYHYLEHRVGADLPFALYAERAYEVPVLDADGEHRLVKAHVFAAEGIPRRRIEKLEQALRAQQRFGDARVGATRILVAGLADAVACTDAMRARGEYFYDFSGLPPRPAAAAPAVAS
jgi:aminoglycoside 3-N-acetyltransferase